MKKVEVRANETYKVLIAHKPFPPDISVFFLPEYVKVEVAIEREVEEDDDKTFEEMREKIKNQINKYLTAKVKQFQRRYSIVVKNE